MDLEGVFGLLNKNSAEEHGQEELDYSEFEGTATSTSFRPLFTPNPTSTPLSSSRRVIAGRPPLLMIG